MRAEQVRRAVYLVGLVCLMLVAGCASSHPDRGYPYPGEMVRVGDHRLHIVCIGSGQPTVVIESGFGNWSMDWSFVQQEVAKFTRVCTYDRAGYGWSELASVPRDANGLVEDLHELLTNADIRGPLVLVGHSFGGPLVRLYSAKYPAGVVGLVLVDGVPIDKTFYRRETTWPLYVGYAMSELRLPRGIATRVAELLAPKELSEMINRLPPDKREQYEMLDLQPKYFKALLQEADYLVKSDDEVRSTKLPDTLPVIAITHGIPRPSGEREWQEAQRRVAAQSNSGRVIVAEHSGHMIFIDEPPVVIASIREVMQKGRKN